MALFTLIGYIAVYSVVFFIGVFYLTRVVRNGMLEDPIEIHGEVERPKRPLSAAHTPLDDDFSDHKAGASA